MVSPLASHANTYSWLTEQPYKLSEIIKSKTLSATAACMATAKTVWSYSPIISRKMRYQEQIARYEQSIEKLDRQEEDADAFQKDLKSWEMQANTKTSSTSTTIGTKIQDIENDDLESSSLQFSPGPNYFPQAILNSPNRKNNVRRLTHSESMRKYLDALKKERKEGAYYDVYSPGQVNGALCYLRDSFQGNKFLYEHIIPLGHSVIKLYEGFDYTTGKQIIDQQELLDYAPRVDYQGNDIPNERIISMPDLPLISGLNASGKPFKDADEFFEMNKNSEGYRLKQEDNQTAYEKHKKGITFFNKDQYNSYETDQAALTSEYLAQQAKFQEENKNFRKGFVDANGAQHSGWIATLKNEKEMLEVEQKQSAKRWYLW